MAGAFEQAWSLLKAIRTTPNPGSGEPYPRGYSGHSSERFRQSSADDGVVPSDPGKESAFFRESLPLFPLKDYIQARETPDYRRFAGFGENTRLEPIPSYSKEFDQSIPEITRQSNFQFAPKNAIGEGPNYYSGVPNTHRPPRGSTQALIDAMARPNSPREDYESYIERDKQRYYKTHPNQKEMDAMNMNLDEYRQMQGNAPTRLDIGRRYSSEMTPPEIGYRSGDYLDSVFDGNSAYNY